MTKTTNTFSFCSVQTSLTPETNYGGGIFHFHCLRAIAEQDTRCLISLAFNPQFTPKENWDVRAVNIRRTYKLGAIFSNLVFFFHLIWLWYIKKERFKLLRISDPYYIGPAAMLFKWLSGVQATAYVFHIDSDERLRNIISKFICRRIEAVIVTSEFSKQQVCEEFGIDSENVYVTYGGITRFESRKKKQEAKVSLGVANKTVLTFLGALSERKNPDGLLDIFSKVNLEVPNVMLLVCGSEAKGSNLLTRLKSRAVALGIADKVLFTGWIDNHKKADIYRATDIFVFPSHLEGFGLAVVESMAEGTPAVVSDRGSLPEVVKDGETGYVRDPTDTKAFAEAIIRLATDQKLRKKLGTKAAERVKQKFTWESCARRTIQIHEQVIQSAGKSILGILPNTGDSLTMMEREGQKDRFLNKYIPKWNTVFDNLILFSYAKEASPAKTNLEVAPRRFRVPGIANSILIPFIYSRKIKSCSVLRVMQTQGALPAIISRILYRVPFVTTYGYMYGDSMRLKGRYTYGLWLDILEIIAMKTASAVIVTTASIDRHVRKRTRDSKIHFIPNGVDLSRFHPPRAKKNSDVMRVLYVGRLEEHKNLDLVISSLAPITSQKVKLWVVGKGPQRKRWEKMCSEQGLQAKFFGTVPHDDLPEIHRKADIFVLPSKFEGHPKVLVEAFASGLPCVGANSPGIIDVIDDGKNGLLADLTVASFAAQLVRLLSDEKLRKKLGETARQSAQENYDLDKLLELEADLLRSMASEIKH